MNASNTFSEGLIMDTYPLATPNNILTDCLNGTLITYNGNELVLQNDVGNSKVIYKGETVGLTKGFVPIGLKEFGGIMYIFSVNPNKPLIKEISESQYDETNSNLFREGDKFYEKRYKSLIGTYPSPDYTKSKGKLINKYQPLNNFITGAYGDSSLPDSGQFITYDLNFDVEHPLTVDCLKSYDGTVNLIFTDNKNIPRLINTRFSVYGNNEYEIIDRKGSDDTNLYYSDDFEYSTSLNKIVNSIVKIEFKGVNTGGNLPVGNYTFYFTLADLDNNESDFVGQSGMVTCHKGNLNDPFSIDGGVADENSYKLVTFELSNLPRLFSRVYVYYSRNTSDTNGVVVTSYRKLEKYFSIENSKAVINITGFEDTLQSSQVLINNLYLTIDKAKAQSINLNILFYGNISSSDKHFDTLETFSKDHITYEFITKTIGDVEPDFTQNPNATTTILNGLEYNTFGGYYNTENIYNFVGYWPSEFYRFGVVYILSDYSLSPVFNMTGDIEGESNDYGVFKFPTDFDLPSNDTINVYGIKFGFDFRLPENVIGYFFVRQKRIKTILAQGVRIGSDLGFSRLPLLYIDKLSGVEDNLAQTLTTTYTYIPKKIYYEDETQQVRVYFHIEYTKYKIEDHKRIVVVDEDRSETYYDEEAKSKAAEKWNSKYPTTAFDEDNQYQIVELLEGWLSDYENGSVRGERNSTSNTYRTGVSNITNSISDALDYPIGWFTESFIKNNYNNSTVTTTNKYPEGNVMEYISAYAEQAITLLPGMSSLISDKKNLSNIFNGIYPKNDDFSNKALITLASAYIGSKQVEKTINLFKIDYARRKSKEPVNGKINLSTEDPLYNLDIKADAMIVPEYEVKLDYFNSIFTGGKLQYLKVGQYLTIENKGRLFISSDFLKKLSAHKNAYIVGVPENTPAIRAKSKVYSSVAGNAAEAHRVSVPFADFRVIADASGGSGEIDGVEMKTDDADVTWACRGIWGPYVGIEEDKNDNSDIKPYEVINITIPNYSEMSLDLDNFLLPRRDDDSLYYPISDRFTTDTNLVECFRGDAFICNFAHTMNRNFADPSFPTTTDIADYKTWYKGYRTKYDTNMPIYNPGTSSDFKYRVLDKYDTSIHQESLEYLNRSDVNAVALGHIFITRVYSSTNLCMRSTDGSNVTERATFNQVRSFYPLRSNGGTVSNKIADSYIQNEGYEKTLGEQLFTKYEEDIPAYDYNHNNRIVYSEIAEKDAISNNLKTFKKTSFLDYSRQYGEIVKLVSYLDKYIVCVFEHAIALLVVNEKAVATNSESGFAYIDTNKVISDTPNFLTTDYGSQWADSVILTATGIYGVDTVAKKIWKVGTSFEVLSDLKILKFLKDYLSLSELEIVPNVTKVNVKTHYNKHKLDIMFTFFKYVGNDLKGWNICYNEITKKFTTFYSWIPSYSGNINNTYYSFDNNYSLGISKENLNVLWEHNKENNWCNWYNEQHPFEFEFVVADTPQVHKMFNNLQMIANKTKPESFHFEIVGEVYNFKDDKHNMYYRQERTKLLYSDNGCDLLYDTDYENVNIKQNLCSTIFPLYVSRVDRRNKLYNEYLRMTSNQRDYQHLSGSEIVYDRTTNDFNIATHMKAYTLDDYEWLIVCGIDEPNMKLLKLYYLNHGIETKETDEYLYKKVKYGRRLGNCEYKEDLWKVQIPSINYMLINENKWDKPPICLETNPVPEDVISKNVEIDVPTDTICEYDIPLKQVRIRDKYIKIRVRYSGEDLAIISAIITQFKESYS